MDEDITFRKGMSIWWNNPKSKYEIAGEVISVNTKNGSSGTVLIEYLDNNYSDRRTVTKLVNPKTLRKRILPEY